MSCQNCTICGAVAASYRDVTVRAKHSTSLFACSNCGFVFLSPVFWLEEAYETPITPLDVGYVARNLSAADVIDEVLSGVEHSDQAFVDFGGGHGLLVRLMRDKGFRFHLYDPFSKNLLAWNCEADTSSFGRYRALTALEVFEHIPDPIAGLREMLEFSDCIIFTTELCPNPRPNPEDWWYLGLEHGQHVSFYTERALGIAGRQFGLSYQRLDFNWHMLGRSTDPLFARGRPIWGRVIAKLKRAAGAVNIRAGKGGRASLIEHDFEAMKRIVSGQYGPANDPSVHIDSV